MSAPDIHASVMALRLHRINRGIATSKMAQMIGMGFNPHELQRFEEGRIAGEDRNRVILENLLKGHGFSGAQQMFAAADDIPLYRDLESLGKSFALLREAKGQKQRHIVIEGLSPGAISSIERGSKSLNDIYKPKLPALLAHFDCATEEQLVKKAVGFALARHREAQGLAPEELAQKAGLDAATLQRFEETGEGLTHTMMFHVAGQLGIASLSRMLSDAVQLLGSATPEGFTGRLERNSLTPDGQQQGGKQ